MNLNNLIIDMKLALQGQAHDELATYDRIKELERIVAEIQECRERAIYY